MLRRRSRPFALTVAAAVALGGSLLVATPAHAATFTADSTGELATAINDANSNPGADTIMLTGTGFSTTSTLPVITETVTIIGPGSDTFTLEMGMEDAFRSSGSGTNVSFSLTGVTIQNISDFAVNTDNIDVVLNDVVVDGIITHSGGDFSATDVEVNDAPAVGMELLVGDSDVVDLTRVTVSGSQEVGFSLNASDNSTVTMTNGTVTGNGVSFGDGFNANLTNAASLTIAGSTFTNNGSDGVDIDVAGTSSLMITDSDASDNDSDGLEVESQNNSTTTIDGVTADRNVNDGIDVDGENNATVTVRNSSAADNGDNGFESDFDGGTGNFENVTSQRNDGDGFDMEADDGAVGSTITLTNAVALDNVENGFNAEPDTVDSSVIINGGRAEGNERYGLLMNVDRGTVIATDFVSTNNPGGGVDIDGFDGQATLRDSTVTGNGSLALSGAGGVEVDADTDGGFTDPLNVLIENTTVSGNTGSEGGGIGGRVIDGSTLTMRNSTVSGNRAFDAGGVFLDGDADSAVTIEHSTVTLNETDGGSEGAVFFSALNVELDHTIIAGNTSSGLIADLTEDDATLVINHSLVQTADASSLAAASAGTGNIVDQDAGLGPLADNGGPTLTHLPSDSSPVLEAGDAAITGAPATDQRGEDRIVDVIDLGAVEVQPEPVPEPEAELVATGPAESSLLVGGAAALLLLLGAILVAVSRSRSTSSRR